MDKNRFLNPKFIYGKGGDYSITIEEFDYDTSELIGAMNLSNCTVRLRLLGAPNVQAKVLLEKIVSETTDELVNGAILNPTSGEFFVHLTPDETLELGIGRYPFILTVMDITGNEILDLTSFNTGNEFNCVDIVNF